MLLNDQNMYFGFMDGFYCIVVANKFRPPPFKIHIVYV
jgi:hypothetical protein